MRNPITLVLAVLVLCVAGFGQKLVKPTLLSEPPTVEQQATIAEGIKLHDARRYDEAIAKYRSVLAENPACTNAMYELCMTLYAKGEKESAMELANRGSKYISDELPLFYGTMANILDDYGKPQEAINIYLEGLKLLAGDPRFARYRSSLDYNLGVTYFKLKKYKETREALKLAVDNDYMYPSPHYLLAAVYSGTNYRIPALLAASRFVSVEYKTQRSANAAAIIVDVLKPPQSDPNTGKITINLDFGSPKDEGDFDSINLILPMMMVGKSDKDKYKTSKELFVDAIDTVFGLVSEDKKLSSSFVGKKYIPFVRELKARGYIEPFAYMVLYLNGDSTTKPWLAANDAKLSEFLKWAAEYHPVK
jgi:hypothetical protein